MLTVTLQTTKSGTVVAKLAQYQPFAEQNKFTIVDKYLFEAPLDPEETFLIIQLKAIDGTKVNSVTGVIQITECKDTITFEEVPEQFEEIEFEVLQIFDVKFQINNATKQSAEIESEFTYLDNEELTVSAIVNGQVPLKRAELRYVITGQPEDEYAAFVMDVSPIEVLNTTSTVSTTIPPVFMAPPAITYWIYVLDEDLNEQESKHYSIGVKPTYEIDTSIELDMPTSKPEGGTIRPSAYVMNHASDPAFGTVSLLVDGETVSRASHLFEPGQTHVPLEWKLPKERKHMIYDVQAKVDLYDTSYTTEKGQLNSFMRTQLISLSDMKPITHLTDKVGKVIAQPALLYASDHYHENLRFRVTDYDGHCFIGGSEECIVRDSTLDQRGGIVSVEHGGIIYRIKYSGADNPLERFSITSIDPLPREWIITLESMDGFIPEAFALKDIELKVRYRTISELITVSSE